MHLTHQFASVCIDWNQLLAIPKLRIFLRELHKQGQTPAAQLLVQPWLSYKDYNPSITDPSPMYFGLGVEQFAEAYLKHYGQIRHKLSNVQMTSSVGSSTADMGVDATAQSTSEIRMSKTSRIALKGNTVYIQVKGTLNNNKLYTANDGNRIPNFTTNAFSSAIKGGEAYKARYILFTTGRGLHYSLEEMSNGFMEVIDYNTISKAVDNDIEFWNELRASVGLTSLAQSAIFTDPEFTDNNRVMAEDAQI